MQSTIAREQVSEKSLMLVAGWAAVVGGVAYGTLPLVQTAAASGAFGNATAPNGLIEPAKVESLGGLFWLISLGAVLFGVGTLAVVIVIAILQWRRVALTAWASISTIAGILASSSWISYGALTRSMAGRAAGSISETGADLAAQQAAYQVLNAVGIGLIISGGICTAVWLLGLATSARAAKVVGTGWSVVAYLLVAVLVIGLWVLAVPPAHLTLIPFFVLFGIYLLVKSRRTVDAVG